MASLIGPALYAGFMDIAEAGGLDFYETTFLVMQKQIFEDQATMHEAFLARGVPAIEELNRARILDAATLDAWRQIDAGELERGNRTLLLREQRDILDRFYVRMLEHRPPEGSLFTYALTLGGQPSVRGGESYPERYPLTFVARVARRVISLRTPLADGNIAVFANRWKLVDEDTLPAYLAYVRDHPDEARAEMEAPVLRPARRFRVLARTGQILGAAIGRWRITIGDEVTRPTKPLTAAQTEATVVDLTPATRPRVWMGPGRRPFDITVRLPEARAYRARAELAIVPEPGRLTVQLRAADLDATARRLESYADAWGFPRDAIADWRRGAEHRPSTDRDHSTHVFTAEDAGSVHVEFEVSHHVRAGLFTLAAHFSA
jgi:hypothetical protein